MPKIVLRLILCAINIRTHHTVQITPPDHKAHHDTPLENALCIVTRPHDRVRNTRVDASRAEEDADVLDGVVLTADEHGETGDAEERGEDVAEAALAGAVGDVADGDGGDCGEGVGRDGEEVGGGGFVAERADWNGVSLGCREGGCGGKTN
jgi:hypothetical protein